MIDTKKEQERDELHRAIWAIADELRGAVDGWDFKNYVLGTMFYRYISENLCNYINSGEIEAGNVGFDFAKMSDEDAEEAREGLVEEKGFFILPSELFCNDRANAANDENLNETLERVFRHIEESAKGSEAERDFAGLFDAYMVIRYSYASPKASMEWSFTSPRFISPTPFSSFTSFWKMSNFCLEQAA